MVYAEQYVVRIYHRLRAQRFKMAENDRADKIVDKQTIYGNVDDVVCLNRISFQSTGKYFFSQSLQTDTSKHSVG